MAKNINASVPSSNKKRLQMTGGKIYFSRQAERRFFFALTVVMLILGLCFKMGVF
jgi:hypothetical protein